MAAETITTSDPATQYRIAINDHAALIDTRKPYDQGPLSSRPPSSSGTPGVAGRRYRSTDGAVPIEWVDTGTSWVPLTALSFSARPATVANTLPADAASAQVLFDSEEWDDSGTYSTSTSRFTPLVAGIYRVTTFVQLVDPINDGDILDVTIRKNGSAERELPRSMAPASAVANAGGSALISANGTSDYFDVIAQQSSTTARRYDTNSYFQGELVRPA